MDINADAGVSQAAAVIPGAFLTALNISEFLKLRVNPGSRCFFIRGTASFKNGRSHDMNISPNDK